MLSNEGMKMELDLIGKNAKAAASVLSILGTEEKNKALNKIADHLIQDTETLIAENQMDIKRAEENKMNPALIDRLRLTSERIYAMAEGLREVSALEDPIGEVLSMKKRPNGLVIGQRRVPLGVVGIIYEARPNVTADAFGLCFKTGNAVILKGGSDAIHSNIAITACIRTALAEAGIIKDAIQLITDTKRETTMEFMKMNQYVDVLIPRGGAGLIQAVVTNSTIPVIETGTGNCHAFIDESADLDMALAIVENGKTQRIGVCNTLESLVIHSKAAKSFLPMLAERLTPYDVEIRGDQAVCDILPSAVLALEEDYGKEYLDYIISAKIVDSIEEAVAHINRYSTGHSETIITKDYHNSQKFLDEIDSAVVYINASTRFTDGYEFGFGAEIGISTQKLHARGPMGLKELTSTKYVIYGEGQIR